MRFRKLRIAWSVVWGLATVLLIVLWVRSNYWVDQVYIPITKTAYIAFGSMPNAISGGVADASPTGTWAMVNMPTVDWLAAVGETSVPLGTFKIVDGGIIMPHWFGATLLTTAGILPWVRRFSLRTLLIATTLVAVVLGLAVWAARK